MRTLGNGKHPSDRNRLGGRGLRPSPVHLLRSAVPALVLMVLPGCVKENNQAPPAPAIPQELTGTYVAQITQADGTVASLEGELDGDGLLTIHDFSGDLLAVQATLSGSALTGTAFATPAVTVGGPNQTALTGTLTDSGLDITSGLWGTTASVPVTLLAQATAPAPEGADVHFATRPGFPGISPGGHGVKVTVAANGTISGLDYETDDAFNTPTGTPCASFTCQVTARGYSFLASELAITYTNPSNPPPILFGGSFVPSSYETGTLSGVPYLLLNAPAHDSGIGTGIFCQVFKTGP